MTPGIFAKIPTDADFTSFQKEGEIKVSPFGKNPNSKYISTVADTEFVLEENSRFKYLASYIAEKDEVTSLKIQKFSKKGSDLEPGPSVIIPIKQAGVLSDFVKFLSEASQKTLASGRFTLADGLGIDPDTYSKLVSLSSDQYGKVLLERLFESGYLTSDLDIPDLIRKGLTQSKIDEKFERINSFEEMIGKPDIKEVSDIQRFLKENPWIFGPEYKSLDFRDAGFSGNPDGRLLRVDGLSDILEVKLPSEELLRIDNKKRQFIAPKLSKALGQLIGYLEYYYSEYSHERDDQTGDEILKDTYGKYYKPKGILLIGRRGKEMVNATAQTISAEPKSMRRLLSYFHWIEVLTYDDLLERARNGLQNLTKN